MSNTSETIGSFTGEGLARALLLDLTQEEIDQYMKTGRCQGRTRKIRTINNDPVSRLFRRIKPDKIFLVKLAEGEGFITMADDETDACVSAVPFLILPEEHSCSRPKYNKSCLKCRKVFDDMAAKLNTARVTWLGWGQPDYNWFIHI